MIEVRTLIVVIFCRVVKVTASMLSEVENLRSWQPRFVSFDPYILFIYVCIYTSVVCYLCLNLSKFLRNQACFMTFELIFQFKCVRSCCGSKLNLVIF